MSVMTTMTVPVSGPDYNELALIKLQNRLNASVPVNGSNGPLFSITAFYTGPALTSYKVAFDSATPVEMVTAAFRSMVDVISRTDSGFMGAPSFSPEFATQGESRVYQV